MRKNLQKPILVDCDGVAASFVGECLSIAEKAGVDLPKDAYNSVKMDTRKYSWWDKANLEKAIRMPGFCEELPVLPGAKEFVNVVREMGHRVIFLTSPLRNAKFWYWERFKWLQNHFGIDRNDLIFATDKRFVNGLIFVDDHIGNVLDWQEYQGRRAVLFAQPWNESILSDSRPASKNVPTSPSLANRFYHHETSGQTIFRTNDWSDVLEYLNVVND